MKPKAQVLAKSKGARKRRPAPAGYAALTKCPCCGGIGAVEIFREAVQRTKVSEHEASSVTETQSRRSL